jgi:hypothetical protein
MTARERRRFRRRPARIQVFAPPPVVDVGRAGRFFVARTLRRPRPRKPARIQVFAPPVVVDVGRAGRFFAYRTRARRPQRHKARIMMLFHTGATPPAPVSGDLRRLLLGVGL